MTSLPSTRALVAQHGKRVILQQAQSRSRLSSSTAKSKTGDQQGNGRMTDKKETTEEPKKAPKSMAELDAEMKRAMESLSGGGGDSGVELEDGKPVSMKRSVRENMFRYI